MKQIIREINDRLTPFHCNYDLDRNKSKTNNMARWILTKVSCIGQAIPIPTKSKQYSVI